MPVRLRHLASASILLQPSASFHLYDNTSSDSSAAPLTKGIFLSTARDDAATEVAELEANLQAGLSDDMMFRLHGHSPNSSDASGLTDEGAPHNTPLVDNGVFARGILNGSRTMEQEHSAFVHISRHASLANATIEVEIPTTTTIGWVYAWMFVPLVTGWTLYELSGRPVSWYMLLLPLTLCAMVVAQDLVNQALSVVMDAPNAITSIQSTCMALLLGFWSLAAERDSMFVSNLQRLTPWLAVALAFVLYQIVNHLVSYWCSLSERVVVTNLCPVFSMILEATVMPSRLQVQSSIGKRCSLGCMLCGALCFGAAYSNFSREGIAAASILVFVTVPYRLVQRRCLVDALSVPVPLLAGLDGLFLAIPSSVIASTQLENYSASLIAWGSNGTIMPMLALSVGAFTGTHVCGLLLLRVGSATSYLVFHNFANFLVVFLGIMFFKDGVLGSPTAMVGLIMSLCGGLWYALEASVNSAPASCSEKSKCHEDSNINHQVRAATASGAAK